MVVQETPDQKEEEMIEQLEILMKALEAGGYYNTYASDDSGNIYSWGNDGVRQYNNPDDEKTYSQPPTHRLGMGLDSISLGTDFDGTQGCDHNWSTYKGLHEAFDFCKKCDIKKETEK